MMRREEELILRIMDARDGKLSRSEVIELRQELAAYPDLLESLDELPQLFPESEIQFDKSKLRKTEVNQVSVYNDLEGSVADKLLVGELEGLLNDLDAQKLDVLKQEGQYLKEFEVYQNTKLYPDKNLLFHNKQKLLRKETSNTLTPLFYMVCLAAAGLAFLLYFSVFTTPVDETVFRADNSQRVKTSRPLKGQKGSTTKQDMLFGSKTEIRENNTTHDQVIHSAIIKDTALVMENNPITIALNNVFEEKEEDQIEKFVLAEFKQPDSQQVFANTSSTTHNGVWAFIKYKLKEKYFGDPKISKEDQLAVLAEKMGRQSGADLAYSRIKNDEEEGFYLKLGSIRIERKTVN